MLVTNIVSFSHNVFYPNKERKFHFRNILYVACKCFQFGLFFFLAIHVDFSSSKHSVFKRFIINSSPHNTDFSRPPIRRTFKNIVGKGENAGNQHFLLFPQCFVTLKKLNFHILVAFMLWSANVLNLDQPTILLLGKE